MSTSLSGKSWAKYRGDIFTLFSLTTILYFLSVGLDFVNFQKLDNDAHKSLFIPLSLFQVAMWVYAFMTSTPHHSRGQKVVLVLFGFLMIGYSIVGFVVSRLPFWSIIADWAFFVVLCNLLMWLIRSDDIKKRQFKKTFTTTSLTVFSLAVGLVFVKGSLHHQVGSDFDFGKSFLLNTLLIAILLLTPLIIYTNAAIYFMCLVLFGLIFLFYLMFSTFLDSPFHARNNQNERWSSRFLRSWKIPLPRAYRATESPFDKLSSEQNGD